MESLADKIIEEIAKEKLGIETLDQRGNDQLDFHDVFVGSLKDALLEAFDAGYKICAQSRG